MKKRISIILLTLCCMGIAVAQTGDRPGWTVQTPKAGNSTYMYVVERATGTTYQDATNNAILKVLRTTMMRIGSVVSWDEVNGAIQKGTDWGTVAMQYNIPINKVCDYSEKTKGDGYMVWILCQVAKSGAVYPDFEEFSSCRDTKTYNNGMAALKSAIIPGLGQMGKRRYGAGIFTLLGEVALVGGAVGTYVLGQDYLSDMSKETNPVSMSREMNSYNNCRTANIVFTAAAGALYVFNIVRAATMTPCYKKDQVAFAPTVMPVNQTYAAGISLTFNF